MISKLRIKGLEIGTLKGDTMGYILDKCRHLEMVTIDPAPDRNKFMDNVKLHADRVHVLETVSDKAKILFETGEFDFVWIDGDHSYEQVKRDITNYLPKVKKGGIIGGHDYNSNVFTGVKKAVDEFGFKDIQFGDDMTWWVYV